MNPRYVHLALATLASGVGALRLPNANNPFQMNALPPASVRNLAGELSTAASILRKDLLPCTGQEPPKPLVMVAVRDSVFQQLVGELVHHITTGNRAGSSWVKPIALRQASNVSLAVAAENFDPCLGWFESDIGEGSVYLFSQLAPAAFVPTSCLSPNVPPALALNVRSLSEAHAASTAERPLHEMQSKDVSVLQAFMQHMVQEQGESRDNKGGDELYDPLSNL